MSLPALQASRSAHHLPTFLAAFPTPLGFLDTRHHTRQAQHRSHSLDTPPHNLTTLRANRRFTANNTPATTRALAQDDNSEPRRSLYQVLTAQRSPPTVLFDSASCFCVVFSTSCSSATMFFFPVITVSFCYAAILAIQATGHPWFPLDKSPDSAQFPAEYPKATFVLVFPWKLHAIFPDFSSFGLEGLVTLPMQCL